MSKKTTKTKEYKENKILQIVSGPYDENLRRLEEKLGVEIRAKGNVLTIEGKEKNVDHAFQTLDALYGVAKTKKDISVSNVDDFLRMEHLDADVSFSSVAASLPTASAGQGGFNPEDLVLKTRKRHIQPRSKTQSEFIKAMRDYEMVFGIGPAGTGKTYLAVAMGVALMLEGKIDKIILSRPAVEAGENLGFLPGDLKEKIDPYLRPLYDALYEMLPQDQVDKKLETGEIEVAPLAFMRGRTLTNAMVILDEAQNTTPMQMKMFLTRLGENSRMVVNGDLSQTDLPKGIPSGLADALDVLERVEGIGIVTFSDRDVVRHGLVSKIVRAYDKNVASRRGLLGNSSI